MILIRAYSSDSSDSWFHLFSWIARLLRQVIRSLRPESDNARNFKTRTVTAVSSISSRLSSDYSRSELAGRSFSRIPPIPVNPASSFVMTGLQTAKVVL
jgi:hypothetical protein